MTRCTTRRRKQCASCGETFGKRQGAHSRSRSPQCSRARRRPVRGGTNCLPATHRTSAELALIRAPSSARLVRAKPSWTPASWSPGQGAVLQSRTSPAELYAGCWSRKQQLADPVRAYADRRWGPRSRPGSWGHLGDGELGKAGDRLRPLARGSRLKGGRRGEAPVDRLLPLTLAPVSDRVAIEARFPRPSVMGVVNVTPDSFSDGGVHERPVDAIAAARAMVEEGAAIVTWAGSRRRPRPVSRSTRSYGVSCPCSKPSPRSSPSRSTRQGGGRRRALELGAELVNDVTALRGEPSSARVVAGGRLTSV